MPCSGEEALALLKKARRTQALSSPEYAKKVWDEFESVLEELIARAEIGQDAVEYAEQAGECLFCGFDSESIMPNERRHDNDCPVWKYLLTLTKEPCPEEPPSEPRTTLWQRLVEDE
jgi:hypothetical protein